MNDFAGLYVICRADDIPLGSAKAFSLARINEDGDTRPFPIVIVRSDADVFFGYANVCPHNRLWLNIGDGEFFDGDRTALRCGRHGARFDIRTGRCFEGPCVDKSLEPVPLLLSDGDVCVFGIQLAEDDRYDDPFDDLDETMEIMIHPD